MTLITRADITGLILAGGQSRRFNYSDKGLIEFKQKPMIAHVIERIAPQVDSLTISCNTNINQYQALGDAYSASLLRGAKWGKCLADSLNSKLKGPLAGIDRHLEDINTPYCFICSCDMPLIPTDIVFMLTDAMTHTAQQACHIVDSQGRHQLALLVQTMAGRTALAKLTQLNSEKNSNASERSKHSIKHWLRQMQSLGVALKGSTEQITSINTPEQLSYMELFNV
ncbi:MAG: NTP transferase domain-containing protein [Pseudomonadota bacterium]|nr:NTP transferase domain-containing protein [Pseudomonadota bacterium]